MKTEFKIRHLPPIKSLLLFGVACVLANPGASALPRVQFNFGTLKDGVNGPIPEVDPVKIRLAIKNSLENTLDDELVDEALQGRLGACTYARIPSDSPLFSVAHGVVSIGQKATAMNLSGPIAGGAPSSGLVLKHQSLKALLRPSLREEVYGPVYNVSEISQVATALRHQINLLPGSDVCNLVDYTQKLAAEMNRTRLLAENFNNIVFRQEGTAAKPDTCAVRLNFVPVSNTANYLDTDASSSGCVYSLRSLPARMCLSIYVKNHANISGDHILSVTRYNNALNLRNPLQNISPSLLGALTASFVQKLGSKLILDLDYTQLPSGWTPGPLTATSINAKFNALNPAQKDILKIYASDALSTVDGGNPRALIGVNSIPEYMRVYFSTQTAAQPLTTYSIQAINTDQLSDLGTTLLPTAPAFVAHTFPVDRLPELAFVTYVPATNEVKPKSAIETMSVTAVNCLNMNNSSPSLPRSIGRIDDKISPVPLNPSVNTGWVYSSNMNYSLMSQ